MKCLFCGSEDLKVIDSRDTVNGKAIRRRRQCLNCGKRFTTYETIETVPVLVIKRDHSRQAFSYDKLRKSISIACNKRGIPDEIIDNITRELEKDIYNASEQEISSSTIGDLVLSKLRKIDNISAVKYAIVFKKFDSIDKIKEFLDRF